MSDLQLQLTELPDHCKKMILLLYCKRHILFSKQNRTRHRTFIKTSTPSLTELVGVNQNQSYFICLFILMFNFIQWQRPLHVLATRELF